jgi:hypothetical protein
MTSEPPPKANRGPAWWRKIIDAVRDYAVTNHIEKFEVRVSPDYKVARVNLKPTPSGILAELQLPQSLGGGDGLITVRDNDGGEVDDVNELVFENTDPDTIDHLTVADDGGNTARIKFPTTTITGAVSGVPMTNIFVTDGTGWQGI